METISRRQSFSEKGINVMSEKEKIIVFSSREICYQSSSFFANQMADAFEDLGFDVQVCEFDEHDDLDAVFQPLYGQKYRLLLDFNSTITRMVEEDGTPVLDKLDGEDNRTILSVIKNNQLDTARKIVYNTVGDLSQPNTGIMFTVPLDFVEGTVKKPVDKEKAKPKDIPEENEKNVS